MLFPLLTWIFRYAAEALGYGLVLGFSEGNDAVLVMCLSAVARRPVRSPGLWLSLICGCREPFGRNAPALTAQASGGAFSLPADP